ncbi:MAG: hypothetical protein IJ781_13695 [Atopobiaceae bacterium]|nr:hypothetical protein [Atopobiaceae bacterium]
MKRDERTSGEATPHVEGFKKGSVDTSALHAFQLECLPKLDELLAADQTLYRKLLLGGSFHKVLPTYEDDGPCLLYLLRLAPSLAFEYFLVYRMALSSLQEVGQTERVDAHVIGAGSLVDALSLQYARSTMPAFEHAHMAYTGTDIVTWPIHVPLPSELSYQQPGGFRRCDLRDFWEGMETFAGNIIFFPKVLSELDEDSEELERFCEGLEATPFESDTVVLCISYRGYDRIVRAKVEPEWSKACRIVDALRRKGYAYRSMDVNALAGMDDVFDRGEIFADDGSAYREYHIHRKLDYLWLKDVAPDFANEDDVVAYLGDPSNVRTRCHRYAACAERYQAAHPDEDVRTLAPCVICEKTCAIKCDPKPRSYVCNKYNPTCFQVLLFQREHEEAKAGEDA